MGRSESWKMWGAIIVILLATGLLAAIWPLLTGLSGGSSASVPFEPETIVIVIPPLPLPPLSGGQTIILPSFVAFAIVAVLVIGAVVVFGVIIGILNYLLARQATAVQASEKYQEGNAALQKKENERLAEKREGRGPATGQQRDYARWASIATSLSALMFAVFIGLLVGAAFFPTGQIIEQDQIVNIAAIFVAAFVMVTLLVLLVRMNPQRLAAVDDTDNEGIPWDTIVVIILGAVVLGLGIGLVVFLNSPA